MNPTFTCGLDLLRNSGQLDKHPRLFIASFLAWAHAWGDDGKPVKPQHAKTVWGFLYLAAQTYYGFNNNLGALAVMMEANESYTAQDYQAEAGYLLTKFLEANVAMLDRVIWRAIVASYEGDQEKQLTTCAALARTMSLPAFWSDKRSKPQIIEGIRCALDECVAEPLK